MLLEREYTYELETEFSDLNENNLLKPHGYQKLFVKLGDMHLNNININIDTTMKSNLAWAFISISMEIVKPLEGMVKLRGKTWHSQRRGPFFRREYLFTDEKGETVFKGCSFSVLLDVNKRTVYRKKEIPFDFAGPIEEFTIEALANRRVDLELVKVEDRKVKNSYIDYLGHVNNLRYSEFAYDVFSQDQVGNLRNLKRMEIYFKSELRKGDEFSIHKLDGNNTINIRGENNTKGDSSFDIIFQF